MSALGFLNQIQFSSEHWKAFTTKGMGYLGLALIGSMGTDWQTQVLQRIRQIEYGKSLPRVV